MTSRFARNTFYSSLAGVSTTLASFISSILVARILGVEGTGTVSLAIWIMMIVATAADIGCSQTLARYLPELTGRRQEGEAQALIELLKRPFLFANIIAFICFVAYAFGYLPLHSTSDITSIRGSPIFWSLCGFGCLLQATSSFGLARLRGMQRFESAALLTAASLIVQLVSVAIGSLWLGVLGAIGGYCTGTAVSSLAFGLSGQYSRLPDDLRKRVSRYAVYAWAGGLASAFLWSRVEVFFLDRFWGAEAVGLFTVGVTLSNAATQGPLLLSGGLLAFFSEKFGQNERGAINEAYTVGTRLLAFLIFPSCLGLAALSPVVIPFLYGSAFIAAVPATTVMVAATSIGAISAVGGHLVFGLDRSDFIFRSTLFGAVLSICAGFIIVPIFGVLGAAVARATVQCIVVSWGVQFISRELKCSAPLGNLSWLLICGSLCALSAYGVTQLIPHPAALPIAIGTGAVVYFGAVRLLRPIPESDVVLLMDAFRRLPGGLHLPATLAIKFIFPRGYAVASTG